MIEYEVVATGSTGNCVIVQKNIMIDCGVSFKKVAPYIADVKLVLLTHVHSDHFKPSTLRRMALEKPLLRFGCCHWMVKPLVDSGVPKGQIDVLRPQVMYGYGICNVIPFELHHDVPNCGYKLHFPDGKVFYATDTGSLSGIVAKDYDLYLVERNFDSTELKERMDEKEAAGQYAYERRVMLYHLSEKKATDWLYKMMSPKSEYVFLHQHVDRGTENDGSL